MAPSGLSERVWRRGLNPPLVAHLCSSLLIAALFAPLVLSDRQSYRTAYGCEGATLSITCEPGHVINVIRANYGRFSITICNNHGNTEWSVNCQSPRTHRVLADRCSGQNDCNLDVSSDLFGDPCPGTFKYIEVHYTCGVGQFDIATTTTSTARPRPPWFIETKEPVWVLSSANGSSSVSPPMLPHLHTSSPPPPPLHHFKSSTSIATTLSTSTTSTTTTTTKPLVTKGTTTKTSTSTTTTTTTTKSPLPDLIDVFENDIGEVNKTDNEKTQTQEIFVRHPTQRPEVSTTTQQTHVKAIPMTPPSFGIGTPYDDVPWCAPSFARGLYWNWTKAGETAVLVCPGGATGTAKRKCLVGEWKDPADLSECRSAWLISLKRRANTPDAQDSVMAVANELAKVTTSNALYGGDLSIAPRIIKTLSRRMLQDVATAFPEPHQRQALVTEFLQSALETGSALLSAGLVGPWGDLSPNERRIAITELMLGLEEAAFLLGDVLPRATQAVHFKSHVLASSRAVAADGSPVTFPSTEDEMADWVFMDKVILPPEAVLENSEGSSTKVIFLTYRHLEDLLSPEGTNFRGSKRKNVSRIVNSRVVSASLGHGRHIQLPEPVTLTFALLKLDNVSNPICAFWDYTTFSWSDEGCRVHSFTRTHVTCKCDHLTNFAVIMEESSGVEEEESISPLRILAYVGCLVCVLCVSGSILIFTLFKSISSPRTYIQRHVCVCLLSAELAFLVGVWRTDVPVLCGITAGFLHYSVLAAFAWMFLEGVHVYLSVTRPIESECVYLRWWHYGIAYAGPLLVVCIAALVDPFSYGTPYYCWLRTDNYFVFSLVGPAILLLAMEVALLAAALFRTCRFNPDEALKTKEMTRLASSRSWLRSATMLLLLMVLTWSLGLLLLHQPSLPVAVAFCVFNALHGIFIFVYYCVRNEKVREWCGSSSSSSADQERNAWIPQLFRSVFVTEKQTYSPNNNNTTSSSSSTSHPQESSSASSPPSQHPHHHNHHHPHHQAISQALNHALTNAPSMQQYLPTLCHVGTLKGHASPPPTAPPFPGATSIMGSRGSLRQMGSAGGYSLPMGSLHQSLPRNHPPPSTTTITTTVTATPLPSATLNPPSADEEVSYKSFSRDSGHGGSEQEDSPRTPWMGQRHIHAHTLSADHKGNYLARMNALNHHKGESEGFVPNSFGISVSPSSVTPSIAAMLRAGNHRSHSPWNHTYMEIEAETDPVYEEIERERWGRMGGGSEVMQVSDLSDEDVKRGPPSDVSRQSSRSYGDSRPLLPYIHNPHGRPPKESQFSLSEERLRDFNAAQMSRDLEHLQKVQHQLSRENLMTVAVLNGEQVVCRLSSPSHGSVPSQNQQNLPIIHEGSRTAISSSYSPTNNGYPSHIVVTRPQNTFLRHSEC